MTDQELLDFPCWLGVRSPKMVRTQEMPSGALAFGPNLEKPEDIVRRYQESR